MDLPKVEFLLQSSGGRGESLKEEAEAFKNNK